MSLIILLILSEDEMFNKKIHEIVSTAIFYVSLYRRSVINLYNIYFFFQDAQRYHVVY